MQSQKIASKNENKKAPTDVVKGSNIPNTDQFKTPKTISKLDSSRTIIPAHANKAHGKPSAESLLNQKSNKQQPTLSQSSVKNVQKSAPVKNSLQHIKSLLNKPGTIFGGDSDESSADDNAAAKKPKKTKEPSLVDSRNDSAMQSQKIASRNENKKAPTDVVKGSNIPNTDQFKTPKTISKLDSSRTIKPAHANKAHGKPSAESLLNQKSNKQQSTLSQSSVKNVQKSAPVKNSSQHIKSLLNKPATIFGGDSDESSADDNAAANSDSSTRTPSGRSSSGDRSHADKRKSVGKDSMNSQSKSKSMSMAKLLSSSSFKRAQVTASQQARDTESQFVDFVPDSQP
ncbi:hypothetical protein Tco_0841543 [Tanacetum coccineum]|uniref:COP1-interacting protein 7 n=1 Tax=Tanacetum coccineum TaxID=301880 RepID=A0ABQ5B100_9ASTR